eukprot:3232913-Pyramimonas_sp.AAC.1
MAHEIVDTCSACRQWQRLALENMSSLRLSFTCNEYVHVLPLFVGEFTVVHLIEQCFRCPGGGIRDQGPPRRLG